MDEMEIVREDQRRIVGRRNEFRTKRREDSDVRALFYYDVGRPIRKNGLITDCFSVLHSISLFLFFILSIYIKCIYLL